MNWTDASCQVGWAESTADKACQAHDTEAALIRLRWAARDFCHRRCERGVIQRVIAEAKDDVLSSKRVLQEILNGRKQAEFQVVTAKRAREEQIEQSLRRKRQLEHGTVFPTLPVLIQDEHDLEPKDSAGCFGRARAKPDLQAHRRQQDELRSLMTNHAREWSELLTHTRNERNAMEDALMLLHDDNIRAAQSNFETWLGLISHCGELEALCSGDGARERLKNVTLEKTVSELQMKVDSLQETVAQQQQDWAQQVEDFERRDRLCVQEDVEIRRRAHSAEKALMLTLERVRTLERAATRGKPIQRCLPSAEEVIGLRQELHKSKAAIAALSASLVFQQTRPSTEKIVRHAGYSGRTSGVLTPVAFDHSVLEDKLGQLQVAISPLSPSPLTLRSSVLPFLPFLLPPLYFLFLPAPLSLQSRHTSAFAQSPLKHIILQCAMDVFSPEWKMEAQMRALKHDSRVGGSALDSGGQVLCLGDLELHCDADGRAGRADGEEETIQVDSNNIRATLSVISSRNTGSGLLRLDEPNLSVAVDGCVTLSRSLAVEQADVAHDDAVNRGQTARHYDFSVAPTSLIRLCVCDWPSNSTKAVQGVVKIDVAQVLPVEWDRGATVVHKDWFVIRNAQGDAVRAHEGAALPAELELVLRLEGHVRLA